MKFSTKYQIKMIVILVALFMSGCQNSTENVTDNKKETLRIISLSGTLTEIIHVLGEGDKITAVDITSSYPEDMGDTKKLGHTSTIKAEGLISLNPTHVLLEKGTIDENIVSQVESAGINVLIFEREYTVKGTKELIKEVAAQLNTEVNKNSFSEIDKKLAQVESLPNRPKILFIYGRGAGNLMVAGENTALQSVIELAGGQNAVSGFESFKPLSNEVLIESNPDFILLFDSAKKSLNGMEGILNIPGVGETNAGKNKNILFMDGQLLSGFGPRLGAAVYKLNQKLIQNFES